MEVSGYETYYTWDYRKYRCLYMKLLSEVGFQFVEPREDRLACGDLGKGALAEVDVIVEAVRKALGE